MNTHRTFGFLAAIIVTVGQFFVVSTSTAAVAQNSSSYETSLNA
jgi:hypothetical protein